MNVLVLEDARATAERAAALIAREAWTAVTERNRACIALSGGRTPWKMIRALATENLPWSNVHIFQTDERVVPPTDRARTFAHLCKSLLSLAPLQPEHVHAMPVDENDLTAAAWRYSKLLEQIVGTPAVLDIIHLGLGSDGHTASLVPGDPVLSLTDLDVAVTAPYQGHRRMTLTYPSLNRARAIIWLVTGSGKAVALDRLYRGDLQMPAGRVRRERATILADHSAARLLPRNLFERHGRAI